MKKKSQFDLDSLVEAQNAYEERIRNATKVNSDFTTDSNLEIGNSTEFLFKREYIGRVEHFYSKIGVVAIKLDKGLSLGDIIEIGTYENAVRQRIESMQINRENVEKAFEGDSIGIKVNYPINDNSRVYKIYKGKSK